MWGLMTRFVNGHEAVQIRPICEAFAVIGLMNGWIVCYKGTREGTNIISSRT